MSTDRPRVAVTVEQFWEKVPGGSATSLAGWLRAHAEVPHRSRLLGVAAAHLPGTLTKQFRTGLPIRHLPLPRPLLYDAWRTAEVPPVQLVTGRVDVVHATTMAIPPTTGPLVVTVHDLAFLADPDHYTERGNRFFRAGLERTRREADLVLVPSEHTKTDCVRAGIAADRVRVVPWGVDPVEVSDDKIGQVRRRRGLDRDYVLWVGTAEPRKNLAALLTAFSTIEGTLSDVDLVLVGPKGWGDALGSGRRPSRKRVKTLGFVPANELPALYAGARAFAYPSLQEGFGLPVLEALAAGIPVVTSAGTPMADLIGDAGKAVNPHDIADLANALVSTAGPDRHHYARHAKPRAAQFPWEATALATEQAYRDVSQ